MTFEQLAVRLAGGLLRPLDDESLREAIQAVLPHTALGELDQIKSLPGMVNAATDTLRKLWRSGLDLGGLAEGSPRLAALVKLEAAVLAALPPAMLRPADLVSSGLLRIRYARALFGSIEVTGITELSPCWRPLLEALAAVVPIQWVSEARPVPEWLDRNAIAVVESAPFEPEVVVVSAATTQHEAVEALRWARELVASGQAEPREIGFASVTTVDYDDYFLALRAEANLDLHFVHGVKATACREGQAAAALADILLRGLSQTRLRRLSSLLSAYSGPFQNLPAGWTRLLPSDSPLTSESSWKRLLDRLSAEDWPDQVDHTPVLRTIIKLLARGVHEAEAAGEYLLRGRVLSIWHKALLLGHPSSLDQTLEALKLDDPTEACVSVAWMPASELAACPRRFVRLVGLNSSRWPRGLAEDRLIPNHIIPTSSLDPLPVSAADRRDFATILATTEAVVVLSRARRDSEGRLLGRSPLLHDQPTETYLRRNRVPDHAFSETDRLMARPEEFQSSVQAQVSSRCWRSWLRREITAHDGQVRADHPVVHAILRRRQSASSLTLMLRNPLGYLWRYGLHWRMPEPVAEPMILDPRTKGDLLHLILDKTLRALEAKEGLACASRLQIRESLNQVLADAAQLWEAEKATPPRTIWRHTLEELRLLAQRALEPEGAQTAFRAFSEVPFGGTSPRVEGSSFPWDHTLDVEIPGTGLHISGYIDRLDIFQDGRNVQVRDYKTGRMPPNNFTLHGGRELQRCLYAFGVKALLGNDTVVDASLHYLPDEVRLHLAEPDATLAEVVEHLRSAHTSFRSGNAVPGPDSGNQFDDLRFALPANAGAVYCQRKMDAVRELLGDATEVWEAH